MRWFGILTALALGFCDSAWAQNSGGVAQGMFGPRSFGTTLQPKPRSFGGGIVTGPAGEFIGRGRATGTTFNPSVWQSQAAQAQQAEVRQRQIESRRLPEQPARPAPVEQPTAPPQPPTEEWFRSPSAGASASQPGMPGGAGVEGGAATAPAPPVLRPVPVSVGFATGQVAHDPAASVSGLLGRTSRIARLSPISVTMDRQTAVLRGRVRTRRDRQLAEDLVRMEPGVWQVRNEIAVGQAPGLASP